MYKNKKILGLITARGGSKGLPGKNIKLLEGKPLIAWTIEQAKMSKYIDKLIVNTDDKKIAKVSEKYGAEVPFMRPKILATDKASSVDVVLHTIKYFSGKDITYDYVLLLEPTSPLRKEEDIDNAIKLLVDNQNNADTLINVGEVHSDTEHPFGIKIIKNGYLKPFIQGEKFYQRQQLSKVYSVFGGMYLSKITTLKKYKTFYSERTIPYLVERWQMYEIDDIFDFLCVEAIIKYSLKRKSGNSL